MNIDSPVFSTRERSFAGCIVTFVNRADGSLRVEHRGGYDYETGDRANRSWERAGIEDTLRDLCDESAGWHGDWKIVSISTPQSIMVDLRARRTGPDGARPAPFEATMLTRVGRIELWDGEHSSPEKAARRAKKKAA